MTILLREWITEKNLETAPLSPSLVYTKHLSCCEQTFRLKQDFLPTVPLNTFICKSALLLLIIFTCEMSNMYHINDRDHRQLPIVEQTVKLTCSIHLDDTPTSNSDLQLLNQITFSVHALHN